MNINVKIITSWNLMNVHILGLILACMGAGVALAEGNEKETEVEKQVRLYRSGIDLSESEIRWLNRANESDGRQVGAILFRSEIARARKEFLAKNPSSKIESVNVLMKAVVVDEDVEVRVIQVLIAFTKKDMGNYGLPSMAGYLFRRDGEMLVQ